MIWENANLLIGNTPVGWVVLDKETETAYEYKLHEVEHVTCTSEAQRTTPNSELRVLPDSPRASTPYS